MSIVQLEPQPNFPAEDISEQTAEILELWLQNREIVASTHEQAEFFLLYRLGHKAFARLAYDLLDDTQLAAFSHGIGAYEATATLVRPMPTGISPQTATLHVATAHHELQRSFIGKVAEVRGTFQEQLPNTSHAIGESAVRYYRDHTNYVISGAALARELEIGTLDA